MSRNEKTLVVILGATATGKSDVAAELARRFNSEVISSDSRQFYHEMPIGTAAPTPEQLAAAPHHMVAVRSVTEPYSCGQYEEDALALLETLFKKHDALFLAGGSGLYINAVTRGMDAMPPGDPALRRRLTDQLEKEGISALLGKLRQLDPDYYARVDRANPQRVVRALEVCLQADLPYSAIRKGDAKKRPFRILKLGIRMPREILYERIDRRVDQMVAAGLEAEARTLWPHKSLNALQTVGYQDFFDYFEGKITRKEAIGLIKRNSRRYAKRQETWFRRDPDIHWVDGGQGSVDTAEAWLRMQLDFD